MYLAQVGFFVARRLRRHYRKSRRLLGHFHPVRVRVRPVRVRVRVRVRVGSRARVEKSVVVGFG